MSLMRAYETSKVGTTAQENFNGSAGAAVRVTLQAAETASAAFTKTSYVIRCTRDAVILQGNSSVTVTASTGLYLAAATYWRIDVEGDDDRFLSVLGGTTTAGRIDITRCSRL